MLGNALCFNSATDVCGETIIFPHQSGTVERRPVRPLMWWRRAHQWAPMKGPWCGGWDCVLSYYAGEILSCVSFLIKVFHNLTIHFHYFRMVMQPILFWKTPGDADLTGDAGGWHWPCTHIHTHTHDVKDSKNDTSIKNADVFCFSLKYSNNIQGRFSTAASQLKEVKSQCLTQVGLYSQLHQAGICVKIQRGNLSPCVSAGDKWANWLRCSPPPVKRRQGWNRLTDSKPTVSLRAG